MTVKETSEQVYIHESSGTKKTNLHFFCWKWLGVIHLVRTQNFLKHLTYINPWHQGISGGKECSENFVHVLYDKTNI